MKKYYLSLLLMTVIGVSAKAQKADTIYYDGYGKGVPIKEVAKFYRVHYTFDDPNYPAIVRDYYMTGELKTEATPISVDKYDNEKSKWKGNATSYYKNGQTESNCNFDDNGLLSGNFLVYGENGKVSKQGKYEKGKIAECIEYDETGKKNFYFKASNIEAERGLITYFDKSENKFNEYEIEKGRKKGKYTEFYPDGKVKISTFVEGDSIHGLYTFYYEGENAGYYIINYDNNKAINNEMKLYGGDGKWVGTYDTETLEVIPETPTKDDCKLYFAEGETYQYYMMNGIQLMLNMNKQKIYGNWYAIGCKVVNCGFKPIDFQLGNITAELIDKKDKVKSAVILSHKEYIAIVEKKQRNAANWAAFGNALIAAGAGVSTSSTTSSNNTNVSNDYGGKSATVAAARGGSVAGVVDNNGYAAVGGSAGYVNAAGASAYSGYSDTNVKNNSSSSTTNYDGTTAFMASKIQQQEQKAYEEELQSTRDALYADYIKSATLEPWTSAGGYFMIKQDKGDKMIIRILLNGITYETEWDLVKKKK